MKQQQQQQRRHVFSFLIHVLLQLVSLILLAAILDIGGFFTGGNDDSLLPDLPSISQLESNPSLLFFLLFECLASRKLDHTLFNLTCSSGEVDGRKERRPVTAGAHVQRGTSHVGAARTSRRSLHRRAKPDEVQCRLSQ